MSPDELDVFNQIVRALEREYRRSLTEAELAEVAKLTPAVCRERNFQRDAAAANVWASKLVNRQGTHIPDFDALYHKKAEFDRRLLGDSNPDNSRNSAT